VWRRHHSIIWFFTLSVTRDLVRKFVLHSAEANRIGRLALPNSRADKNNVQGSKTPIQGGLAFLELDRT